MISSKILCRRPRRSLCEDLQEETQRRKKSGGQLYVNGYRVRQGPGHSRELEGDGLLSSLYTCLRVLGGWGKRGHRPPPWTQELGMVLEGGDMELL